ncbi:MAG TPA: hypothetical protein VMC07_01240 [Candidatus Omnitrophota bacterium]|nr:hypothetical protein [Candidatus Omnitrophota bacterium]
MDSDIEIYFEMLSEINSPERKDNQTHEDYEKLLNIYSAIRSFANEALTGKFYIDKIRDLLKKAGRQGLIPIDSKGLPTQEGVYLVRGSFGMQEIDVYQFKMKGLCCFSEDFGSEGTGVNDSTDCHVSVQNTGLEFIIKVGELKHAMD